MLLLIFCINLKYPKIRQDPEKNKNLSTAMIYEETIYPGFCEMGYEIIMLVRYYNSEKMTITQK